VVGVGWYGRGGRQSARDEDRRVGVVVDVEVAANVADVRGFRAPLRSQLLLDAERELLHRRNIVGVRLEPEHRRSRCEPSGLRIRSVRERARARRKRVHQARRLGDRDLKGERLLHQVVRNRHLVDRRVEKSVRATDRGPAIAKHVVRKTEAWCKVIERRLEDAVRNSRIAGKHQSQRRRREALRLLSLEECRRLVLAGVHREILPAQAKVQAQVARDAPVICHEQRRILRMAAKMHAGALGERVRFAEQEVSQRVSARAAGEGEQAVRRTSAGAGELVPDV